MAALVVGAGAGSARSTGAVAVAIAAGRGHTCAVTSSGGVVCWGLNDKGQLGNGTTDGSATPVPVTGLSSGVASIAAGGDHTCAVTSAGAALCWGLNNKGQLGDGTTTDRLTPVPVVGLSSGVAQIDGGFWHTCAVMQAGGAKCWGYNGEGELGNGDFGYRRNRHTPVDVVGLSSGVRAISTGAFHTCAVTQGGAGKCWGANFYGQLGDGTTTLSPTPVDVVGLSSGTDSITAGAGHSCAVTTAGAALCWGNNASGQLGDGSAASQSSLTPIRVYGLSADVTGISAGDGQTCAVTTAGAALCWGLNSVGQLGAGTLGGVSPTPLRVRGDSSAIVSLSTGSAHSCATTSLGGTALCWGYNQHGQLGDGTHHDRPRAVAVVGFGP